MAYNPYNEQANSAPLLLAQLGVDPNDPDFVKAAWDSYGKAEKQDAVSRGRQQELTAPPAPAPSKAPPPPPVSRPRRPKASAATTTINPYSQNPTVVRSDAPPQAGTAQPAAGGAVTAPPGATPPPKPDLANTQYHISQDEGLDFDPKGKEQQFVDDILIPFAIGKPSKGPLNYGNAIEPDFKPFLGFLDSNYGTKYSDSYKSPGSLGEQVGQMADAYNKYQTATTDKKYKEVRARIEQQEADQGLALINLAGALGITPNFKTTLEDMGYLPAKTQAATEELRERARKAGAQAETEDATREGKVDKLGSEAEKNRAQAERDRAVIDDLNRTRATRLRELQSRTDARSQKAYIDLQKLGPINAKNMAEAQRILQEIDTIKRTGYKPGTAPKPGTTGGKVQRLPEASKKKILGDLSRELFRIPGVDHDNPGNSANEDFKNKRAAMDARIEARIKQLEDKGLTQSEIMAQIREEALRGKKAN